MCEGTNPKHSKGLIFPPLMGLHGTEQHGGRSGKAIMEEAQQQQACH